MKGKSWPNIMHIKDDGTVTSLNNLTDDITILSNDNANIQVSTEGQSIKIDSSQVSANKADITTNFNKYLEGYDDDGTCIKNSDCNNALVNGRWFSEGKPNDPNAPTTANGILETYRPTSGSLYQRYTPYSADSYLAKNLFHQRRGSNVDTEIVWSEWTMLSTEQTTTNTAAIATNKTDITTNFNKYLEGYDDDGNFDKSIDCNKSINNGTWYCPPSTLNIPAECVDINASGYLEVTRATTLSLRQIFTPYRDSHYKKNLFWIRTAHDLTEKFADDTFDSWVKFGSFDQYLAGLGTNGRTSKNNDCNSAIVNGRWYSEGTPNDPNAPTVSNGILETYRATTGSVYQKYTPYASSSTAINRFYQRSGTDASTKVVWSKWVEFSTTINGLIVGTLLWNDTTAKAMGSNMMPASGIHYLDPVIFPELFEKIGYTNGRKGDLFKVGIDPSFPYLSVVRTGRISGSKETDVIRNITGTAAHISETWGSGGTTTGAFGKVTGFSDTNTPLNADTGETGQLTFDASKGITGGSTHISTSIRPANTACYLNRIATVTQNIELEKALKDTQLITVRCIATNDNLGGFAENELMGEMEVPFNYQTTKYHYDEDNKIIIDKVEYWISESQTKVEPLEVKEGFTQLFKDDKFEYEEDHRKEEVYLKTDGSLFTITELGEIPNEYTTISPPTYAQYYKFNTDKWVLDASKKDNLISVISDKVKSQTENNISTGLWLDEGEEVEFTSTYEHLRFTNISDAKSFIKLLKNKTMEELIDLLNTKEIVI